MDKLGELLGRFAAIHGDESQWARERRAKLVAELEELQREAEEHGVCLLPCCNPDDAEA